MSLVTVSQVEFGGSGSTGTYSYYSDDIQALLAQSGATSIQPVNVTVMESLDGVEGGSLDAQVTAMIATDSTGSVLSTPNNQLALPCPRYCRSHL